MKTKANVFTREMFEFDKTEEKEEEYSPEEAYKARLEHMNKEIDRLRAEEGNPDY